ncbi:sirohydrochlorin chelatase [Streptomyces sp. A3M-1-3]|uniref:sirohydrochlorin chelatase n=1 Tax=Streptomyces sp. A3M-1-3 TaxID=2962044 RepID=UPI0020B72B4C|nr:sirohydrochlorin chelatase [Streptomyces sp. A3M-1-3]MCP3817600.1 sirohydrochlorin chelatase [Streptomyces sp. A3M-1-3]
MTESAHLRESLPLDSLLDSPPDSPLSSPLDTTAQLLSRITTQLGSQLSHVHLNGTRRPMPSPTLVVVAHGSRDPQALRTVTALLERVRELRPQLSVRLGHIELNEPLLPDTLAALSTGGTGIGTGTGGIGRAVLVPLLLSRGYHVKQDLPQAAAAAPRLHTRIARPLGPHPLLVEALYARLVEAGWPDGQRAPSGAGVVLAAAGSRDPESAADTRRTAEMLSERLGGIPVLPAYASAASPTVPEAVRALTARGRHRVAVASYFAAPGRFATQCAERAPWIASAPLGAHPALARLLLHRYDEALTGAVAQTRRELATA